MAAKEAQQLSASTQVHKVNTEKRKPELYKIGQQALKYWYIDMDWNMKKKEVNQQEHILDKQSDESNECK